MSFVVRKTTSTSNATLLSYLELHKHQESGVTREVTDFFFFQYKYFYLLWFVYKPELSSKFSLSTFLHFPINHIHDPLAHYPVWSVVAASSARKRNYCHCERIHT